MLVLFASLIEESPKRSISEILEQFLSRIFFQHFEGCSRVSLFCLNNWDNEEENEYWFRCSLRNCKSDLHSLGNYT